MIRSAVSVRALALATLGLCAAAMVVPAAAQAPVPAETTAPRFSFAPVEGGALKLDRETGRVSLCAKGPTGFACTAVPDTRDAYEAEIARLKAENNALRAGAQAKAPAPPPGTPPDMSDLDRAFSYMEHFYRRLRSMIEEYRAPDGQERL